MDRPNTLSGLIEMHREIAGKIDHHRKVMAALVFDLEAVEHTIRLLDAEAQLGRAKPVPAVHAAFKGEMRRDVMAVLRSGGEPATSLQIARMTMTSFAPSGSGTWLRGCPSGPLRQRGWWRPAERCPARTARHRLPSWRRG